MVSREQVSLNGASKRIHSENDVTYFHKTQSYSSLINFLRSLSTSVRGVELSSYFDSEEGNPYCLGPPTIRIVVRLLDGIRTIAEHCPPLPQPSRFGNRGYQVFYDKMTNAMIELIEPLLKCNDTVYTNFDDSKRAQILDDLKVYLADAFGNRTRIDYGTGHELNFIIFLLCLAKLNLFDSKCSNGPAATLSNGPAATLSNGPAATLSNGPVDGAVVTSEPEASLKSNEQDVLQLIVFVVFKKYISLMRYLQKRYMMEPAGSRGVWGIDDFHFLPFYFGSSQLINQNIISPSQACDVNVVRENADRYLYLDAIREIIEVKKGVPLHECSPLLNDITSVATWAKVNSGLLKMYEAEVLSRLPVVQHIQFGSLFPFM